MELCIHSDKINLNINKNRGKKILTKKNVIIILCVLIVLLISGLLLYNFQKKKTIIDFPKADITRAYIVDGNNGNTKNLTGDDLDTVYDLLKAVSVKSIKKEDTSGWLYTVNFEKEKNTASIEMISSTIWEISGQWYEVSASDGEKVLETVKKVANNEKN